MALFSRTRAYLPAVCMVFVVACGYSGLSLEDERELAAGGDGGDSAIRPSSGGAGSPVGGAAGSGSGSENGGGSGGRDGDGWGGRGCYFNCPDVKEPYLIFSNFELQLPGEQVEDGGGQLHLEAETVHRGDSSLKATQGEPGSQAEINQMFAPAWDGHLYLRAWLYIPQGNITSWLKLVAFHSGEIHGIDFLALADESFKVQILSEMEEKTSLPGVLPENQWFCLQVDLGISQFAGSVVVHVDGTEVLSMLQVDTDPGNGLSQLVYGIADTGFQQVGATIYWDDVALSREYVSCEAGL